MTGWLLPVTIAEPGLERREVVEHFRGRGEDPAGRLRRGHGEQEIDRLPQAVSQRDLGGRSAALRGGAVPEREEVIRLFLDQVEVPGDELEDDIAKARRVLELPAPEVREL